MSETRKQTGARGARGPGGGMPGHMPYSAEKSKDFKGSMRRLLHYIKGFRIQIAIVIGFAVCSTIFSIIGPKLLGMVTTEVFEGMMRGMRAAGEGQSGAVDFPYIGKLSLILVALYAASALFAYVQNFIMSGVSMKITYQMRKDISEKINKIPLSYFDGKTHGEVLSRITNDVDTVSQTLNQSMTQMITSVTTVAGVLIMMASINWLMTLTALVTIPLSMLFVTVIVKQSQKHFKNQQKYLGEINGHVEELYTGHNVVQAYGREAEAIQTFNQYNEELYQAAWKSQFLSAVMMPVMGFVGNLSYVAVCVLGGYLAIRQKLAVGDIQAFIQYVRSFTHPVTQLANISNVLQSTAAAAERVFAFLEEEEESKEKEQPVDYSRVKGNVSFRHIHFGYTKDAIIINDFSADIKAGQKVAIVGLTGAGKTTVVKLLMRFYDLQGGKIFVDGYDINDIRKKDLRAMFGMVLQDTWLYSASIMENIRYGNFDKSDGEVIAAAEAAHCDEFIRKLPAGYQMLINEEANNISEGQKQLLTIARTFLADPPILILDEATSSVDTRTETLIQKAMAKLLNGRTSFVIAHRLSTIRDADWILVMKSGDIIEQGRHEQLLAAGGFYAQLYHSQFDVQ